MCYNQTHSSPVSSYRRRAGKVKYSNVFPGQLFHWGIIDITLVSGVQHDDLIFVYTKELSPQDVLLTSITIHSYIFFFLVMFPGPFWPLQWSKFNSTKCQLHSHLNNADYGNLSERFVILMPEEECQNSKLHIHARWKARQSRTLLLSHR